tara:strand:- start:861 stop:1178 length:318 start_codon:yes stop_codon:yes gene_type:complete
MNIYIVSVALCTATFVDNEGNKYLNTIAAKIDENTYVFGQIQGGYHKMVGVNTRGKKTGIRYVWCKKSCKEPNGAVTRQNWGSGRDVNINYNVEDVKMDCIGTEL